MQFIQCYENAFSDDWCDEVVEKSEWYLGQEGRKEGKFLVDSQGRSTPDLAMQKIPEFKPLADVFWKTIDEYYSNYKEKFPILRSSPEHSATDIKIRKITFDQDYSNRDWHYELQNHIVEICGRVVTYTIYLNDVHEGGETAFAYQKIKIHPRKGMLVFFPTSYTHTHRGYPPIEPKTKWIVTGWMKWPVTRGGKPLD